MEILLQQCLFDVLNFVLRSKTAILVLNTNKLNKIEYIVKFKMRNVIVVI